MRRWRYRHVCPSVKRALHSVKRALQSASLRNNMYVCIYVNAHIEQHKKSKLGPFQQNELLFLQNLSSFDSLHGSFDRMQDSFDRM